MSGALLSVLEEACAEQDLSFNDLTVLSSRLDPYRLDTPAGHRDGEWLAQQLDRLYGPTRRAHWRGLHYAIVADGRVRKPGGGIFTNDDDNWTWLSETAGKAARWLGYIHFDRIADHRNAAPIIHRQRRQAPHRFVVTGINVTVPNVRDITPGQAQVDSFQGRPATS
jgi:hypothetical protein